MAIEHQTFGTNKNLDSSMFVDRRRYGSAKSAPGLERRQFSDGHQSLSSDASELGRAIDQYKLVNRRRFITHEEMLAIITELGYRKS